MAIKNISAAWKAQDRLFPKYERVYADFRQYIYPPVSSTLTYTAITSEDNQPGSHNVTGGYCDYVLPMADKFTLFIRCKPTFDYDTSSYQYLWRWYIDATHTFDIYYSPSSDKISVAWLDGGTARFLLTSAYASSESLQIWHNITITIDLTTGTTSGGALYINQSSVYPAWSGNANIKVSNFPLVQMRRLGTTAGDWNINQIRYFPNYVASAAEVANLFKDVENEEIVWNFNGEGCGRTRCNITRHVMSLGLERSVEEPSTGSQSANRLTAKLYSNGGEYADDQYATFDPTTECFNGTSSQKYLQKQSRIEAETWYGTVWEPIFTGRLDNNLFSRTSYAGELTTVDIAAEDSVSDIAREMKRKGKSYASKKLSDTTESNSLIHLITRLATKKDIYNYLANSSFENSTISNSWAVAGTGATLTRVATGLFGSYRGDLTYGTATMSATQTVTFTGTKKLNVGETYNFSIWLKSSDASTNTLKLAEADSGGDNDYTEADGSLDGNEYWKRFEVSHTITDSDSDRLKVSVSSEMSAGTAAVTGAHMFSQAKGIIMWREDSAFGAAVPPISTGPGVLSMDGAMLIQGDRAHQWWVLNNNDGASAVESADDADYDSYDTIGFDVDAVDVEHPWVFIPATTSIWEELKQLGDACGATYLGMDAAGTLKMRAKLKTGYTDPSALETIDDTTAAGVDSVIELAKSNKIVGHGVTVTVGTAINTVWMLEASSVFTSAGGKPKTTVTNGSYFPDPTTYGDFFAKYGEVTGASTGTGGIASR